MRANPILSYFTRHRTLANLILILMIVAGVLSFPRMRAQFFPDIVIDSVSVSVAWPGAGAEDVDRAIVQVIDPVLLAVDGVTGSSARSSEGSAAVRLEFEPGWDMDQAVDDVSAAMDTVRDLTEDAEDPVIRRARWSDRVTDVVLTGPVGVDQLARFGDEFVARLFAAGVTDAVLTGVVAPETRITVPSLSLIRHDITLAEIAAAIAEEVNADPAGDVSGTARVRTGTEKRSAAEIGRIVLRSNPDGSTLTVADVAEVTTEGIDRDRAYFVGENPAVQVSVTRTARGDAIDLQRTVEEVAAEFEATLPAGVSLDLIRSRADYITGRLALLLDNGLIGLALVVALLFLFLNARTAFWVALGIPAAMSAAIFLMYMGGLTLNMISLFALIITLGIVVDDAIVVGEHADFRARVLREPPVVAAENAATRMFTPVFSATITTIIAFFGLTAISGQFGSLIADIPYTVIIVLVASLLECFLILPNHMSHSIGPKAGTAWYDLPSRLVNRGFDWVRRVLFRPFVAAVIWARYPVLAGTLAVLGSQVALLVSGEVQWRFFSPPEQNSVSGNFAMLPGATREDTLAQMAALQAAVEEVATEFEAQHGVDPVTYAVAQIGGGSGRGLAGADDKDADLLGAISIELVDADLRPFSSFEFVAALQEAVERHPLVETISFRGWRGGPGGDAIDIQLFGATPAELKAAAETLKTELSVFPEVSALEDDLAYDKDELILDLTPQGAALGFSIDGIGRVLRDRLGGIEAASYPDGVRSATIRVALPEDELTADFLDTTLMRTPTGAYVPLADIVTVERRSGFSRIQRENGILLISVTGDLDDEDADRAAFVMDQIEGDILPRVKSLHGVEYQISGLSEQEREFLGDAYTGLALVMTGIFLTLAWIFQSWTRPLVVLAIVPFGLVGAIWGHDLWGVPLSMFSVVGLIGMTGIIINDSIVLVTTIDDYAKTRGLVPAIIDGTTDRLRPVLLTTLTTVLGLAPLLYEGSSQAEFLKPTVITLVYGLGFGMVLVLMVVPALIAVGQDLGRSARAARRALHARSGLARAPVMLGALGALTLFGVLLLPPMLTGQALPLVAELVPASAGGSLSIALGLYLVAVGLLALVLYLGAALAYAVAQRRALRRRAT